jgi:hypothetical protein
MLMTLFGVISSHALQQQMIGVALLCLTDLV